MLISMPRINSINFYQNRPKISFCQKKSFFSIAGGFDSHTLCLRWLEDPPPDPATPPSHRRFLATRRHEEKFTARYCRPPFVFAFGFKYVWNVRQRRCSHSQTVYNTAKSTVFHPVILIQKNYLKKSFHLQ